MTQARPKSVVKQRLYDFLRKIDHKLGVKVPVEFENSPVGVLMYPKPDAPGVIVDLSAGEWDDWGANAIIEWWSLSKDMTHRAIVGGEEVVPTLLNHPSNLLHQGAESIFLRRSGGPSVAYFMDERGVHGTDYISPSAGGTVCILNNQGVGSAAVAEAMTQLTIRRTISYDATFSHQGSQTRFGRLLLEEVKQGAHHNIITDMALLLRSQLPKLKAGVPSIKDVQSKLEMESKLRLADQVTGSLRPLVFTLHALEGSDHLDNDYPGLWLVSTAAQGGDPSMMEIDVREHFRALLLWDSLLYLLSSGVRFHGEFKPGLIISREDSRVVYAPERRYSKRDGGEVESAYIQINPLSIQGDPEAIAFRLIQFATHELAHLGTYSNIGHSESFQTLRESYQSQSADFFLIVKELVGLSGLGGSRYGARMKKPIAIDSFIAEVLYHGYGVPISFLAGRWAALRNISLNKAESEVIAGVKDQASLGRLNFDSSKSVVLPL